MAKGVKVVEMAVGKRRRGRPPRNQGKADSSSAPPLQRENQDEEDVCFICFDGGSFVLCDRHCPKTYHPACIKRDDEFFKSKAKWNCGWHIFSTCQKVSYYMCYTCTYSLCKNCTKDVDYVNVRGNKGFCGLCRGTIMMIESTALGTKEMEGDVLSDIGSRESSITLHSTEVELSVNNIETDKIWHYQDPFGKIHRPFPMAMLRRWSKSDLFPLDLRIWRTSERQEDSILLTDVLAGQYNQAQHLFHKSCVPTKDVRFAPNDGYQNKVGDVRESWDLNVDHMENIVTFNAVQSGSPLPHRDSVKGDNYFSSQPLVSSSLPSSTFPGKPCETQSHLVFTGHGVEKWDCGSNNLNENSNKTSEGQIIDGNVRQDDTEGNEANLVGKAGDQANLLLGSDHAATPSSGSGHLAHSSLTDPAENASGWDPIILDPDEYSFDDESVPNLLAEVEAMKSLNGLISHSSILRCDGELAQGVKPDCFNPSYDPGKSDALCSTNDLRMSSQSTMTNETIGASESEVLDA
ncbi:hypothetical protein V6N11_049100 [Hibiscus sabdariffa]|uniref:GYF domain-containing protein n=1 Tax=Hibiscus sabdariffa TaxID=183260 RepID=A0ABR2PXC1_9ROSI